MSARENALSWFGSGFAQSRKSNGLILSTGVVGGLIAGLLDALGGVVEPIGGV